MQKRSQLPSRPGPGSARRARGGFTLTELLVVIGLIVLLVTLAIPAFNVITGGKSIDTAENRASAFLGQVRQDALALQEPRGVLIIQDPDTSRLVMVEVYFDNPNEPEELEIYPNTDPYLLPTGIGGQVLADGGTTATQQYLPFGVILFNGSGQLLVKKYTPARGGANLITRYPAFGKELQSQLSQFGFVLYDQAAFADQSATNATWVRDNAVPFLVNRYNGSLMRGE